MRSKDQVDCWLGWSKQAIHALRITTSEQRRVKFMNGGRKNADATRLPQVLYQRAQRLTRKFAIARRKSTFNASTWVGLVGFPWAWWNLSCKMIDTRSAK